MTAIRTRFAPSPTGYLHIGGARTALFSWAFAREGGGQFVLRIEDTDSARSTDSASRAIINAMDWLGLNYDEGPIYSSARADEHRQLVRRLLAENKAYYCYATPEELSRLREEQIARSEKPRYDRRWRDSKRPPPPGVSPTVRFKTPMEGAIVFDDAVKGKIAVANSELDDLVILRADGRPTYNLAVVADDAAAKITHVIRGEDHVSNTPRQMHLFYAMEIEPPQFAHVPLLLNAARDESGDPILNESGEPRYERMSKRNGAVDVMRYRDDGFLSEAMINYLARLGWSPADASEVFDREFFVRNFSLDRVQRAPARFDVNKLRWLNHRHLSRKDAQTLGEMAGLSAGESAIELVRASAFTLNELREASAYFESSPPPPDELLSRYLAAENRPAVHSLAEKLRALEKWNAAEIKRTIKEIARANQLKFAALGMPLRALLTGRSESPDIAEVAEVLGREESLRRIAGGLK